MSRPRFLLALFIAAIATQCLHVDFALANVKPSKVVLEDLYKLYVGKAARGAQLSTWTELRRWFSPRMVTAIQRDRSRAAKRHEPPLLDGDPIVDAQDWDIADVAVTMDEEKQVTARATVRFTNGSPRVFHIDLVSARDGWRIDDIDYGDHRLSSLIAPRRRR